MDPDTGLTLLEDEETTGPTGCYEPQLNCNDPRTYSDVELQLTPDPSNPTKPLTAIVNYSAIGRAIYWSDGNSDTRMTKGGFYDGAVRVFGAPDDPRAAQVRQLGDDHAVSDRSGL